jgi:hypothetical protein
MILKRLAKALSVAIYRNGKIEYIHAENYDGAEKYKGIPDTLKYADASNNHHISINQYSDIHYKIWCIEGSGIEVRIRSSPVSATLNEPFGKLFYEMFPNEEEE